MRRFSYPLAAFSFGLGALELLFGRKLARKLGLPRSAPVLKTFGARELASGALLLAAPRSSLGAWSRVAGDVMDLATLGTAACRSAGARAGTRGRRPSSAWRWRRISPRGSWSGGRKRRLLPV